MGNKYKQKEPLTENEEILIRLEDLYNKMSILQKTNDIGFESILKLMSQPKDKAGVDVGVWRI